MFRTPFCPHEYVTLDPSFPAIDGLIFAATMTDGSSPPAGGSGIQSREIINHKGPASGLIHAVAATPFGKARNRTDATSNYVWPYQERYDLTTGDFTIAFHGIFNDGGVVNTAIALYNSGGSNQARIMFDCTAAVGYSSGSVAFWTFDGATTVVAQAGAIRRDLADWWVGVRRGTTLELWRSGIFLNSATGTARNVTGTGSTQPMLGAATGSRSTGYYGPILIWRRGITPSEQSLFSSGNIYPFIAKPRVGTYVTAPTASATGATTVLRGLTRSSLLERLAA